MTTQRTNRRKPQFADIGDDLIVARKTRRTSGGGIWVVGTVGGHRFNALVFAEHAEYPAYELGDSRISKLWLKGPHGGKTVANFDRGWDVRPTTKIAQAIVDFLAAGLAEHVYGN